MSEHRRRKEGEPPRRRTPRTHTPQPLRRPDPKEAQRIVAQRERASAAQRKEEAQRAAEAAKAQQAAEAHARAASARKNAQRAQELIALALMRLQRNGYANAEIYSIPAKGWRGLFRSEKIPGWTIGCDGYNKIEWYRGEGERVTGREMYSHVLLANGQIVLQWDKERTLHSVNPGDVVTALESFVKSL